MALPSNQLTQVATYQASNLAYLQNLSPFVTIANTKFKDFDKLEANLGSTVTFDIPGQYSSADGLVATFQPSVQLVQNLTASQSANVSYAFSAEQFIFNAREYMEKFGKWATLELANKVETDIARNANSSVRSGLTGAYVTDSGPTRFYGDGTTAINSYTQLATMIQRFRNPGMAAEGIKVILPDTVIPSIVGSGLNQFAPERNNEIAMSWEVGKFGTPPVEYYQSNLLPEHNSGNVGNNATVLTVVSTNDPTGQSVTQISFSGAANSDLSAIKSGDLLQFKDAVSNQPNMRMLTYYGHAVSSTPVQFRATADAGSDGSGNVTINIYPALVSAPIGAQNINNVVAAGMQVTALPSHKCGLVLASDALYLAMPKLPDQSPFVTANKSDPETGVSMRMYFGSLFGQNQQGFVHDALWGSTIVPRYCMRIAFPLSQAS